MGLDTARESGKHVGEPLDRFDASKFATARHGARDGLACRPVGADEQQCLARQRGSDVAPLDDAVVRRHALS